MLKKYILALVVCALPAWAEGYTPLRQHLVQGGLLVGQAHPQAQVFFEGASVPVNTNGLFVVGFERHQPLENTLKICRANTCTSHSLLIEPRTYKKQIIKGVPAKTVNPSAAETKRVEREAVAIKKSRSGISNLQAFAGEFIWPAGAKTKGPISGVYGNSRTYNGEERNWHKGLDIALPTGTPVVAPADGKVVLAANTFMNGNLVVLDHGQQVFSIYAHLNTMHVKTGADVVQGQHIADIGTTGRSTGPHLHWGLFWGQRALDPGLLIGLNP